MIHAKASEFREMRDDEQMVGTYCKWWWNMVCVLISSNINVWAMEIAFPIPTIRGGGAYTVKKPFLSFLWHHQIFICLPILLFGLRSYSEKLFDLKIKLWKFAALNRISRRFSFYISKENKSQRIPVYSRIMIPLKKGIYFLF